MKNICLTSLMFLFLTVSVYSQIWIVDPLEALYPDRNNEKSWSRHWSADFIMQTDVAAHLLVKTPKNSPFTITAEIDGRSLADGSFFELIDVPVEQNTGLDSRTELYTGAPNPFVIRKAPFKIYEVIKPVDKSIFISDGNYRAFRFVLPEAYKSPGETTIKFTVTSQETTYVGEFKPRIHAIDIPSASKSEFFYTNWFNLSKMEYHHGVVRWTEAWFEMLDKYASLMSKGRQNAILIPAELIYVEKGEIKLAADKMWRFLQVFQRHGFRFFEAPHLMNRGPNDDWGDAELKVALSGKRYYTEGGKKDVQKIITLLRDFAVKHNIVDNWLQHISDEPTAVNAACYRDIADQVKELFPEALIMEATNDRDNLAGAIDIWCPIINDFQENEAFFRNREQKGEQIFVYTCLIPGGQWLNRTLDMEKLRQVYFGWGAARYNTDGYLHWGLNQYQADPYQTSAVKHPSPGAGPNNYLPAGDTHIIYPGKNGPLSSLRFEAHRGGIEDYELLQLLKIKDEKRYEELIARLFRTYTDYNLSIQDYRAVKRELLETLKND
ncbi:protein of unknown function [Arenibacter nanhaiticus]|uniref:Glycoside hydrolase 123 catalytic domain-containing protein n=1 Tax=Arenibacter nanhaiticus TaxID=558155 RepID=A0A1M6CE77_9FLAO|nr:DUF4091 domain-containing protein [Arenibacter nanhaiticus]SHI59307.1 protein of unknown function [Arenibacter nanhaiticus]